MRIKSAIMVTLLLVTGINLQASELPMAPELAFFEDYLGTWEASMTMAEDQPPVTDVTTWERALNGKAIRTLHSINDGMYGGESIIFWDKSRQKLVFHYFTTADFRTEGEMEVEGNTITAVEEVQGTAEGVTRVRSVMTLDNDSIQVESAMMMNGEWQEPESRTYTRSDKEVIFK